MDAEQRQQFDRLLEAVLDELPADLHELLEQVPLIVEDHPARDIVDMFELESRSDLCGLHDGIPLTERSVDGGEVGLPDHIMIYREGIASLAREEAAEDDRDERDELLRQIRITVLHEIGHHFGLDEDDLAELGYD